MIKNSKVKREGISYWLSYSDMMAALILVLVLILSVSMFQSKSDLEKSEAELEEAKYELEKKQQQINENTAQLDEILGVKKEIIKSLQAEFKDSNLSITIDSNTGAIVFDSELLFDPDQYVLKSNSKSFLDVFLPKYFSVLMSDKYQDNISEIMIEGHTAHYGTYMENLELSQKRAFSVAEYILRDGSNIVSDEKNEALRNILTANGRSWCDPIYNTDGTTYNDIASRRVEIKFRLKDEETIQQILDMLDEN